MDASLKSQAEQLVVEIVNQATTVADRCALMRLMMKSTIERSHPIWMHNSLRR